MTLARLAAAPSQTLETARLRLRPATVADAPAIFSTYAQDPLVTRFLVWAPHRDVHETEAFLRTCEDGWREGRRFPWAITLAATGELIGMIELGASAPLPAAPGQPDAQEPAADLAAGAAAGAGGAAAYVGYVLARRQWGRGYATEALRAVVDAALAVPGMRRVHALVDVDNTASQRVLEKAGLRREALLSRHMVHSNISAEPRDVYRHATGR